MKLSSENQAPPPAQTEHSAEARAVSEQQNLEEEIRFKEIELSNLERTLASAIKEFEKIREVFMRQLEEIQQAEERTVKIRVNTREYQATVFGRKAI